MATTAERVGYRATVREMPSEERPRERLERYGAGTLTNAELLAILLRVGSVGENVIELANRLLREYGGLAGLLKADLEQLRGAHGMGLAKATQVKAALELARRLNLLTPEARPQIKGPADIAQLLMIEMGYLAQEQLRVLCLDTKNYVVRKYQVDRPLIPRRIILLLNGGARGREHGRRRTSAASTMVFRDVVLSEAPVRLSFNSRSSSGAG